MRVGTGSLGTELDDMRPDSGGYVIAGAQAVAARPPSPRSTASEILLIVAS
jgi:hypothetical protein